MDAKKKNYDVFDLAKFILSLMIVALHSMLVPGFLTPIVRTAVPLFFIMSSFLLFEKKRVSGNGTDDLLRLFAARNLKLYLFWTVVLFPMVILYNVWYTISFPDVIIDVLSDLLFNSFPASWYIPASVIAVSAVYYIPQKHNFLILAVSLVMYFICCADSNYYYLFESDSAVIVFADGFRNIVNDPHLSFLVAFIWIAIGKLFAENGISVRKASRRIGIFVSAVMLYAEYAAVQNYGLSRKDDCYIFLVPLCFFIFAELKEAKGLKVGCARTLRKMSTVIYCLHLSAALVYREIFRLTVKDDSPIFVFVLTVATCFAACFAIFKLEAKERFCWLRYSH